MTIHDPYDRSSKWVFQHHGDALLILGRIVTAVRSWRALAADVVQPRQLPDGLLEVQFVDRDTPDLILVEIATYPEKRVERQLRRDLLLVLLDRDELPEVLLIVLQPRGNYRVPEEQELASRLGLANLKLRVRVVELWTIPAVDLLAANDVGLIPWALLAKFDGPPEPLLRQCRQIINAQAAPEEHANVLAVCQVLLRLRYNQPELLAIFGGTQAMIESPLIQEIVTKAQRDGRHEARHKDIVQFVAARFGAVPPDIIAAVQAIRDETTLEDLVVWAAQCRDLGAFRERLM